MVDPRIVIDWYTANISLWLCTWNVMAKSSGSVGNRHFYTTFYWRVMVRKMKIQKRSFIVTTLTMFPLFIISSTVFLRGTTKHVRPLCKHPKILPSIWSTSSEELKSEIRIGDWCSKISFWIGGSHWRIGKIPKWASLFDIIYM